MVSIHAPTWGATVFLQCRNHPFHVSIHAPTWGATFVGTGHPSASKFQSTHPHGVRRFLSLLYRPLQGFNPRTHMGCDAACEKGVGEAGVSIHAPTWGATCLMLIADAGESFQSTHPHGVRPSSSIMATALFRFQSTHPHGVRLEFVHVKRLKWLFQSTHPHGVRPKNLAWAKAFAVSIHAPTWGATPPNGCNQTEDKFQSTHPHGVRRIVPSVFQAHGVSIHAPTWGATQLLYNGDSIIQVSIHAPTWGATRVCTCKTAEVVVSIHAPTWGATQKFGLG